MAESTVIALVFEDEQAADHLFDMLEQIMTAESFPVDNAAVAVYRQSGEVIVKQMTYLTGESGFSPRIWEFLLKTVLSGWGHHIDDWSIENFKQVFQPGTSAFFSLIESYASGDLIHKLREFKGHLIYAGLTDEQKAMLKAAASD